ncbi:MAG: hypothetical protein CVT49_05740 [candidate division Zixibacteria bacterium HGW-Zixibacteria-1]|nr:MAG: hypothetical protein CVT49_05740 [candidate division Zixibacteria bacterium HGW-Zixibacteria-1]
MKKNIHFSLIIILAALIQLGCGGDTKDESTALQQYLPAQFTEAGFIRASEVRAFPGNSLWEYIDGQAELYYLYNFVDVATTIYKKDEMEFEIDIYHFGSPDDSYGLYSMIRNPADDIIGIGVEGFLSPGRLVFTKGEYLVKLTGFDETDESMTAIVGLGRIFEKELVGKTEKPAAFGLFPAEDFVAKTDRYYADSYLGQKFLTRIYSREYIKEGDSLTLFITADEMGDKYAKWLELADRIGRKAASPNSLPFDQNFTFVYEDPFYGQVIVGLKSQKLVGIVNFSDKMKDYLTLWLESL